jgi:hypothetical protein
LAAAAAFNAQQQTLEDYYNYMVESADYVSKITGDIGDMMLETYKK